MAGPPGHSRRGIAGVLTQTASWSVRGPLVVMLTMAACLAHTTAVAAAREGTEGSEQEQASDNKWYIVSGFDLREAPWIFAFRLIPGLLLQHMMTMTGRTHSPQPPVLVYFPSTPNDPPGVNFYGRRMSWRSLPEVLDACAAFLSWSLTEGMLHASSRALGPGLFTDSASLHWLIAILFKLMATGADTRVDTFRRHVRVYAVYLVLLLLRNLCITLLCALASYVVLPRVARAIGPSLDPQTAPIWLPLDRSTGSVPDTAAAATSSDAGEAGLDRPTSTSSRVPDTPAAALSTGAGEAFGASGRHWPDDVAAVAGQGESAFPAAGAKED